MQRDITLTRKESSESLTNGFVGKPSSNRLSYKRLVHKSAKLILKVTFFQIILLIGSFSQALASLTSYFQATSF